LATTEVTEAPTHQTIEFAEETKEIPPLDPVAVKPTKKKGSDPKKQAQISYKKNARLFTNENQKLNIDTDAINELFNYGGEHGQIMMTEDEE
jgi:hypothetical protein